MSLSNAIFWENYAVSDILKLTNDVKLIDGFQTYVSNLTGVELSNKPYENEPITLSTIVTPITRSDLDNINYSNDDSLNALLDKGVNLNYLTPVRNIIYYSFDSQNFNDQVINTKIAPFNQAQQKTTRSILNYASIVTGIQFQEVALSQNADLHFANTDLYGTRMTGLTNKYSNYQYDVQTDVITNYSVNIYVYLDNVEFAKNNETPISGTLGYEILLHEVGHALGLKHPFESPYVLPAVQDNTENTVMSYSLKGDYKTKFQPLDLAALNWIYCGDGLGGKSNSSMPMAANSGDYLIGTEKANKLIGSAGNDTLDGGAGRDTLIGGDGNDIYIVDNGVPLLTGRKYTLRNLSSI